MLVINPVRLESASVALCMASAITASDPLVTPTSNFNSDMLMFSPRATISTRRTSDRRSPDLPPPWLSRAMAIHRVQQPPHGMEKSTL